MKQQVNIRRYFAVNGFINAKAAHTAIRSAAEQKSISDGMKNIVIHEKRRLKPIRANGLLMNVFKIIILREYLLCFYTRGRYQYH